MNYEVFRRQARPHFRFSFDPQDMVWHRCQP